jgi:hypothetical protein
MAAEFEREDGFVLVHSTAGGWDIHAPARPIDDLDPEVQDLVHRLVDRRFAVRREQEDRRTVKRPGSTDRRKGGPERRLGAWFGWVLDIVDADAKIALEKRERLHH